MVLLFKVMVEIYVVLSLVFATKASPPLIMGLYSQPPWMLCCLMFTDEKCDCFTLIANDEKSCIKILKFRTF